MNLKYNLEVFITILVSKMLLYILKTHLMTKIEEKNSIAVLRTRVMKKIRLIDLYSTSSKMNLIKTLVEIQKEVKAFILRGIPSIFHREI